MKLSRIGGSCPACRSSKDANYCLGVGGRRRAVMMGFGLTLLLVVALAFGAVALKASSSSEHDVDDCVFSLVCGVAHGPLAVCNSVCGHPHLVPPVTIAAGLVVVVAAFVIVAASRRSAFVVRLGRRLDRPPQLLV